MLCTSLIRLPGLQHRGLSKACWHSLFTVLLVAAGCNDGRPPRVPISGKVLIDGQPLQYGYVQFIPNGARPSGGRLNEKGEFSLSCFEKQDGAVLGLHRIAVNASETSNNVTKWYAPKKYQDVETSALSQKITEPTKNLVIELTWDGGKPFSEKMDSPIEDDPFASH